MSNITATAASGLSVSTPARRLIQSSISRNTRQAYTSQLCMVDNFACGRTIDDSLLADYLGQKFDAGASPATLKLAVAAVNFRARHSNSPSPAGILTMRTLRGACREGVGRGLGQAAPVDWATADAMAAVASASGDLRGKRDASVILVASDALLRVSEIAALRVSDFDGGDRDGGRITITRSKTDVEGKGAVLYLRPRTVAAVKTWLDSAGIAAGDSPLFRSVNRHGGVSGRGLGVRCIRRIIKTRASDVGADGRVSGHSLRVGSAVSIVQAGGSLAGLMAAGRWKTTTSAARYSARAAAGQGAVATLRPA